MGSLMSQQMASGVNELSKKLQTLPADEMKNMTNPQVLLDSTASASLPGDVLLGLRHVFSNAVDHLFLGALCFVGIGLIASFFIGNARLVEKKKISASVD